jgi:poly(A) polymerase
MEEHPEARAIINILSKAGFVAYYAGGWVRDYLLQIPSDDIDIATNAPPETIQALFPHTVPIGIAFGIVLVIIDHKQYEVATFRQDLDYQDGRRPSQIAFTTAIEDAKRRDFTINGMFFDPIQGKVLDYVGGRDDLQKKIIRAIGDPHQRIHEDRLRMIRAIRFSCRLQFTIDPETEAAIRFHAGELLPSVAIERIWQEFTKGHAFNTLPEMLLRLHEFGLLRAIFPSLASVSIDDMKERVSLIGLYPKQAPVIAFFLPLFPSYQSQDFQTLCKELKLPKTDLQFVLFLLKCKELIHQDNVPDHEWAHLYASPLAEIALNIILCHNKTLKDLHEKQKKRLEQEILRIREKRKILTSKDLLDAGVPAGKNMGLLLEEGEKIAIDQKIENSQEIILQLKQTLPHLWKENR